MRLINVLISIQVILGLMFSMESFADCVSHVNQASGRYVGCVVIVEGKTHEFDASLDEESCRSFCDREKVKAHTGAGVSPTSTGNSSFIPHSLQGALGGSVAVASVSIAPPAVVKPEADVGVEAYPKSSDEGLTPILEDNVSCRKITGFGSVAQSFDGFRELSGVMDDQRSMGGGAAVVGPLAGGGGAGSTACSGVRGYSTEGAALLKMDPLRQIQALRQASTKSVLSRADERVILGFWEVRREVTPVSVLLSATEGPSVRTVGLASASASAAAPASTSDDEFPPPLPKLIELRYGKAARVLEVTARDSNLLAQGVEYQKGGLGNLVDIMMSGFVHGYVGPMSTLLDSSMSSLKHGPYWVILDGDRITAETESVQSLLYPGPASSFYVDRYHLAYLVPDEKEALLRGFIEDAHRRRMISEEEMRGLLGKIMPYREYLAIPQEDEEFLTESDFKTYLRSRKSH